MDHEWAGSEGHLEDDKWRIGVGEEASMLISETMKRIEIKIDRESVKKKKEKWKEEHREAERKVSRSKGEGTTGSLTNQTKQWRRARRRRATSRCLSCGTSQT